MSLTRYWFGLLVVIFAGIIGIKSDELSTATELVLYFAIGGLYTAIFFPLVTKARSTHALR